MFCLVEAHDLLRLIETLYVILMLPFTLNSRQKVCRINITTEHTVYRVIIISLLPKGFRCPYFVFSKTFLNINTLESVTANIRNTRVCEVRSHIMPSSFHNSYFTNDYKAALRRDMIYYSDL